MAADIARLVADGHLDLDSLVEGKWVTMPRPIAEYNGDRNDVERHTVHVQFANAYGITAWRWVDMIDGEYYDRGGIVLDVDECKREAKKHAASEHREVGK